MKYICFLGQDRRSRRNKAEAYKFPQSSIDRDGSRRNQQNKRQDARQSREPAVRARAGRDRRSERVVRPGRGARVGDAGGVLGRVPAETRTTTTRHDVARPQQARRLGIPPRRLRPRRRDARRAPRPSLLPQLHLPSSRVQVLPHVLQQQQHLVTT